MNQGLLASKPVLQKAMAEAWILEAAQRRAQELRLPAAKRVLERASAEDPEQLRPDVAKLRAFQVAEANAVVSEAAD
eukprot:7003510-Pyramimonas_sp.AAC.1